MSKNNARLFIATVLLLLLNVRFKFKFSVQLAILLAKCAKQNTPWNTSYLHRTFLTRNKEIRYKWNYEGVKRP